MTLTPAGMPARRQEMKRTGFAPRLAGSAPVSAGPARPGNGLARTAPLERQAGLAPVSAKRRAENRQRAEMIAVLWPERPQCSRPGCPRWADDVHEPLTRARGGSIVDPGNARPLCRPCHDEVTFKPESELGWAYEAGLLVHSWDGPGSASPGEEAAA